MPDLLENTKPLSLWNCLHDGSIEYFQSDLIARTLTIVVDSPYHWDFHKLPTGTRFQIVGEDVRIAEAFEFEPWLGTTEPSKNMSRAEAQEQRLKDYEKGRLISSDWNAFVADVQTHEDYETINAELTGGKPLAVLDLAVISYPNSKYRTIKIHAERFRFPSWRTRTISPRISGVRRSVLEQLRTKVRSAIRAD